MTTVVPTPDTRIPRREEYLAVTVEQALAQFARLIDERTAEVAGGWAGRVTTVIGVFLAAIEADPQRAWRCLVDPVEDSLRVNEARRDLRDRLVTAIEHGAPGTEEGPDAPSWAAGAVGSLWELGARRLTVGDDAVGIDDVAGSVAFLVLAPRLGADEATRLTRSGPKPSRLDVRWPAVDGRR
ncbi:MAG: hypothetical protein WC558_01665 [Patulibacter sp.]